MELRDEILPRAQNIQSRLDRQTIETEEVWAAHRGLEGDEGLEPVQPAVGSGCPACPPPSGPFLLTWTSCLPPCPPPLTTLVWSPLQVNKTLKATLQALLEVVASDDGDVLDSFQTSPSTESLKSTSSDPGSRQAGRRRGQQQETETFYLTVGRAGLVGGTRGGIAGAEGGAQARANTWGSSWGCPEAPGVSEWTEHPRQAAGQAREAAGGPSARWAQCCPLPRLSPAQDPI